MRIIQISLMEDSDVLQLRRRTKELAQLAGIRDQEIVKLVTAVSEIARNALHYAKSGTAQIEISPDDAPAVGRQYIRVKVEDRGKGIDNLDDILAGNYVSQTGLGKGLLGSKKLVDQFDIQTGPEGTTVILSKEIAPASTRQIHAWSGLLEVEPNINAIDEIQRQNQELLTALSTAESLRHAVEEANQHKTDFLANMSHEIRTPMNAIVGISNILWRSELNEDQRKLVHGLQDAGNSLLAIINDILDLSKIEAGKLQIVKAPFDPIDTTYSITSLMKLSAQEKGLALNTLVDASAPRKAIGDSTRFRQVLLNLISNAVKYTSEGEVLVYLSGSIDRESFRCAVCDTGIGMSKTDLNRAFEPFEQIVKEEHRGTGLGLPIVQRLVELMGGTISAESRKGVGSAFALELPCLGEAEESGLDLHNANFEIDSMDGRKPHACDPVSSKQRTYSLNKKDATIQMYLSAMGWQPIEKEGAARANFEITETNVKLYINGQQHLLPLRVTPAVLAHPLTEALVEPHTTPELLAANETSAVSPDRFAGVKALLVEDHPLNQLVMTTELKDRGIEVDVASTGKEALSLTQAREYDIILMDCQLTDLDGYEVTRQVREFEQKVNRRTPIVAVTAYAMQGDRERCLAAGMDDYISKPVQISELVRVLEQWTSFDSKTGMEEDVSEEDCEINSPISSGRGTPLDLNTLLNRFKPKAAQHILEVFIEEGDESVRLVKATLGLSDLSDLALEDTSESATLPDEAFVTLARQMHSMRGACGIVFADPLAEMVTNLEQAAKSKDLRNVLTLSHELEVLYQETKKFIETEVLQGLREGTHPG